MTRDLLAPSRVVLEILETVDADDAVVRACRALSDAGDKLAVDDYAPGTGGDRLLPYAQHVESGRTWPVAFGIQLGGHLTLADPLQWCGWVEAPAGRQGVTKHTIGDSPNHVMRREPAQPA